MLKKISSLIHHFVLPERNKLEKYSNITSVGQKSLPPISSQSHMSRLDPDLLEPLDYLQSIGNEIVNNTQEIKFKPLYQDFATLGDSGPVESIMLKVMPNASGIIQNVTDFKRDFLARLEEKLGKNVFEALVKEGSIENINSYNIGNDSSFFITLNLVQLRAILTPKKFEEWKSEFLAVAKGEGIVTDGKLSSTLIEKISLEACNKFMDSFKCFSHLSKEDQDKVLYERDLWSIYPNRSSDQVNQYLLDCNGSINRNAGSKSEYVKPGNQLAILTQSIYADDPKGDIISYPHFLAIVAPGLDAINIIPQSDDASELNKVSQVRPEIPYYLDVSTFPPKFHAKNYQISFNNICDQVILAANECKPKRAVLCAVGCGVFMTCFRKIDAIGEDTGLYTTDYTRQAVGIVTNSFALMIMALRNLDIEVTFTDYNRGSQDIWDKVNLVLAKYGQEPIYPVSDIENGDEASIGKGWGRDGDMHLIAADPDALLGNKGDKDNTAEGQYGRRSIIQFLHFLACKLNHIKSVQPSDNPVQSRQENCSIQ